MIVGQDGHSVVFPAFVGGFQSLESSSGGQVSCRGEISLEHYLENRLVYTAGSKWVVSRGESADVQFVGDLTEPSVNQGRVEITARGCAIEAEREIRSRLYATRGFEASEPADSEPHEYAVNKHIEVDIRPGRIKWRPQKDFAYSGGEMSGAILHWEPGQRLSRSDFRIKKSENDSGWEFVLSGVNTEDDGVGATLTELETWDLGVANPDGTDIEYQVPGDYDLLYIGLRKVGAGTPSDPPRFWITRGAVYGAADGPDFDAGDLVRDLCAILGWDDTEVESNGTLVLPYRIEGESARAIFDYVELITGWRVVARRTLGATVCNFGSYTQRVYSLIDGEYEEDLQPLERFNRASVVYRWAGGNATSVVKAMADPDPLRDINEAPPVTLSGKQPTKAQAEIIAQRVADELSEFRVAGTVKAVYVLDENGFVRSAHDVRAGDALYHPRLGMKLKVQELSREEIPVTFTFLSHLPFVERLDAKRARKLARLVG